MSEFIHLRHKPYSQPATPNQLVLAIPQLRSNVNLARIARAAGCCGVKKIIACGNAKIDPKIARDSLDFLEVQRKRSLPPVLKELKSDGYRIVGLEQTTHSHNLHEYQFQMKSVLVIGHERLGMSESESALLDDSIEIPVFGLPLSYNVATATAMALYEYCRQWAQQSVSI